MGVAADWRAAADEYDRQLKAALKLGLDAPGEAARQVEAIVRDLHGYAERQIAPSLRSAFLRRCGLRVTRETRGRSR